MAVRKIIWQSSWLEHNWDDSLHQNDTQSVFNAEHKDSLPNWHRQSYRQVDRQKADRLHVKPLAYPSETWSTYIFKRKDIYDNNEENTVCYTMNYTLPSISYEKFSDKIISKHINEYGHCKTHLVLSGFSVCLYQLPLNSRWPTGLLGHLEQICITTLSYYTSTWFFFTITTPLHFPTGNNPLGKRPMKANDKRLQIFLTPRETFSIGLSIEKAGFTFHRTVLK